jgi:F0F1-type ATP synthase assembly protein I
MASEHARLIWLQCAVSFLGTILFYWEISPLAAKSFMYGSSVALASAVFLAWRARTGRREEKQDAERVLRHAYRTAIERMAWVIVMLAAGFKYLKLAPLWMLTGFIAGQAAWLLVPVFRLKTGLDKTEDEK